MKEQILKQLLDTSLTIAAKGLAPATGGNFSARLDSEHFLITSSGVDKTRLTLDDYLTSDLNGTAVNSDLTPSAETLVHAALYQANNQIGAVLHTHSVSATVLSRLNTEQIVFSGYEMQKSITGNTTHNSTLKLPVLDNTQDMPGLRDYILKTWENYLGDGYGFVLQGHGLYAWGATLVEAQRHIEGFEFLLECEHNRLLLERNA